MNYIDEIGVHVKENNIKGFQDILSKEDFDINSGYIGGRNILHILIENNATEVFIKEAISRGADVNKKWISEDTPLYTAIKSESQHSSSIVKILLENGADPNIINNEKKESPLYTAIKNNKHNSGGIKGQYLLSHGASVNPVSGDKPFILMFLSEAIMDQRYYLAIDHLIKTKNLDINYKDDAGNSILDTVINNYQKDSLLYLLKKDNLELYNINEKGQDALMVFIESRKGGLNHQEAQEYNKYIVDILIDKKNINLDNKDKNGLTAIEYVSDDHSYLRQHIKDKKESNIDYNIRRRRPSL